MPKRLTKGDFLKLAEEKNVKFINIDKYNLNNSIFIDILCKKCGETHPTNYRNLKKAKIGCQYCAGNIKHTKEDFLELEKIKNITFVDLDNYKLNSIENVETKCNICGHIWMASYNRLVSRDTGCPNCIGLASASMEDYLKLEKIKNIKFFDLEKFKLTNSKKIKTMCFKCGNIWDSTYKCLKYRNYGCPNCSSGKGEKITKSILEYLFQNSFIKIRPDWLKNPKTKYNLELDGYCSDLNLAFEYNGEQHYIDRGKFKGKLAKVQERDELKLKLCKANNTELIIIKEYRIFTNKYIFKKIKPALQKFNFTDEKILEAIEISILNYSFNYD